MTTVYALKDGKTESMKSVVEPIVQSVRREFTDKAELFTPILVRMDALDCPEFERTKSPGVYLFIREDGDCLKVGKSQSNASKRALQHCGNDNTSSTDKVIQMAHLRQSDKTYMLVFALQNKGCMHWVLALEHFLENTQNPRIRSIRNG